MNLRCQMDHLSCLALRTMADKADIFVFIFRMFLMHLRLLHIGELHPVFIYLSEIFFVIHINPLFFV